MSLTTIPPEVFSDITRYLDDVHCEALHHTGDGRLISLLRRSVKRIEKVKKMHVGFIAVESITIIDGEHFELFPKLKHVGLFRPILDDDILLVPSTITSITISVSYPLKAYPVKSSVVDKLPKSVTSLNIDWLAVDNDYTFREGYVSIIVNTISSKNVNDVVTFPVSATCIGNINNDCRVVLSPNVEILKTHILVSGVYNNLKRLTCECLHYKQQLPHTIEYLYVKDFVTDGSNFYSLAPDTKNNILRNCANIFSLPRLTELSMPLPHTAVNLLPNNISKLTVNLEYSPNIIARWETSIVMKDISVTNLSIDKGTISSISLPVTLTKLSCRFMHVEQITHVLPNLKYLHVDSSNNNTRVTTYDFSIYEHLTEIHTTRSVLLSKLPKSLLRLTCNSVLHEADEYPLYLESLHMRMSYSHYIDYLKSIMKYCDIKVDELIESPEKRLSDLFENNPVPHITKNKNIMRKLEIKIYWCDMFYLGVIGEILKSKVTENSINLAISMCLREKELSYIARYM